MRREEEERQLRKTDTTDALDHGITEDVESAYDIIASRYSEIVGGAFNTEYERPATLELLGDVSNKSILDAGCGPGSFSQTLVAKGAQVFAFDSSGEMVRSAKEELGETATVVQGDLNQPFDFVGERRFDIVLSSLVLDYIKDWDRLFRKFSRILYDHGRLVFSIHHPFFLDLKNNSDQIDIENNYFQVQLVEEDWTPAGMGIPSYRRPLSAISTALWQAGFLIERIIEPKPTEAWKEIYAPLYEKWLAHPVIICLSAQKQ